MIDFAEMPGDGKTFARLIERLLVSAGLETQWVETDAGRGRVLTATEVAPGLLAPLKRKWLVACSHDANSEQVVRPEDLTAIYDACASAHATAILLVSSTRSSPETLRGLKALESRKGIVTRVWDHIELEARLNKPNTISLVSIFLPKTAAALPWKIWDTASPALWAAEYKGYFLYLAAKEPTLFPAIKDVEAIVEKMERVLPPGSGQHRHCIRPRAVYFNDYHRQYRVFADYISPRGDEANIIQLNNVHRILENGQPLYPNDQSARITASWNLRYISTRQDSPVYRDVDHENYYAPFMDNFQTGRARDETVSGLCWVDLLPFHAHIFD